MLHYLQPTTGPDGKNVRHLANAKLRAGDPGPVVLRVELPALLQALLALDASLRKHLNDVPLDGLRLFPLTPTARVLRGRECMRCFRHRCGDAGSCLLQAVFEECPQSYRGVAELCLEGLWLEDQGAVGGEESVPLAKRWRYWHHFTRFL